MALVNIREPLQEYDKAQCWDPFFNIFINALFLTIDKSTLYNYADDITLYTSGNDANAIINKLKQDFSKKKKCFCEKFYDS